jgi:acid phosphatase family membrane protein YuiD
MLNAVADVWNILVSIVTTKIFIATFSAWFFAQALKLLIHLVVAHKLDFRLLVGTGGMPSSHTASVTALSMSVGLTTGFTSPIFLVALLLCVVVISDALGVRRAAGRQARLLNMIVDELGHNKLHAEKRMKELLGHTPIEAAAGILIGIIFPILLY